MSSWIRMGVVMASAVIALGCQGKKEISSSAGPSAEASGTAGEVARTGAADESKSTAESDAPPASSEVVAQAVELLQINTIKPIAGGIRVTFFLDISPTVSESSTAKEVTDAMMFATFYAAPILYARIFSLDTVKMDFVHQQKNIGTITMTRASFEGLHYGDAMKGAGDPKAKQAVYRKLIKQLPKGAVAVDEKFAP